MAIFWVAVLLMNAPTGLMVSALFQSTNAFNSSIVILGVFLFSRFLISLAIVMLLRYVVRTHILKRVGRRKDHSIIRELEWSYLISVALLIGQIAARILQGGRT